MPVLPVKFVLFAAAALAAATLGAAPRAVPLIVYSAPAGDRPAGADPLAPGTSILPNGRIASADGRSVFVGTNPLGVAVTPDGRFAIVSNAGGGSGGAAAATNAAVGPAPGDSLAVVNAQTMSLASVYRDPSAAFFRGVAAVRDPADPSRTIVLASDVAHGAVRVFDLDASGTLQPESNAIALASSTRRAFPAGIAIASGGRTAYVADNFGNDVSEIDVAARAVRRTIAAGDFPLDVAAGGGRVAVTAGGLSTYATVDPPVAQPRFAPPAFDPFKSSSLFVFDGSSAADPITVPMDPAPDGDKNVGGADPGAMAIRRDGSLAYVALANVDRIAVVSLAGTPRVVRGLDLRLFPNAPYGAQPSAVVLSNDQKRLYVALAGLNAVAVLDARAPTRYRYGLIPTGWYPTALAISPNGRFLYVTGAKGIDGWGMLTRVDLKHTSLVKATMNTLRYNRTASVAKFNAVIPPLRSGTRSSAIDHVVYVAVGTQTYDAMLGDLRDTTGSGVGNGNPAYAQYPENVTPNLHELARTYALADNFYAADADDAIARLFATGGDASLYAQLTVPLHASRAPLDGEGSDPEDYGRAGYLFNAFARAGLSFRDYGGLLQLSGYGDELYHLDVPALAALSGNADTNYSGDDAHRAQEFVRDMQRYIDAKQMPSFTYVWLPTPSRPGAAADADHALGTIVEYLSNAPNWSSTAVFIVPEGVAGVDHVNPLRSYCLVVSPLARKGYVGRAHLSVPSVVKTEEEIFGLPPLGLNDLLATDMADFFADAPDPQPFHAIR
jgi:YVTN family beta-propeller protein